MLKKGYLSSRCILQKKEAIGEASQWVYWSSCKFCSSTDHIGKAVMEYTEKLLSGTCKPSGASSHPGNTWGLMLCTLWMLKWGTFSRNQAWWPMRQLRCIQLLFRCTWHMWSSDQERGKLTLVLLEEKKTDMEKPLETPKDLFFRKFWIMCIHVFGRMHKFSWVS